MSRTQSPGYPNFSLPKAIDRVRAIHSADRRNIIDREVAAKHMGYSSLSGASDKALATLAHYGLLEKAGKGQTRVTQLAVDIMHPDSPIAKKKALNEAGFMPSSFYAIRERFSDGLPSEGALKSWLTRENYLDRAIGPVAEAYLETWRFLEQEGAIESGGPSEQTGEDSTQVERDGRQKPNRQFGGAKVGDLIQWESAGVLQFEKPLRVRMVSEDGQWVAVEGSQTGIPMSQVFVDSLAAPSPPPMFALGQESQPSGASLSQINKAEKEWLRGSLSKETSYRIIVSGDLGPKEIGKLIKLLKAQQAVLSDDEEDDGEP